MPFFPIPAEFGTEDDIRRKYTEQQLYEEFTTDENGGESVAKRRKPTRR